MCIIFLDGIFGPFLEANHLAKQVIHHMGLKYYAVAMLYQFLDNNCQL